VVVPADRFTTLRTATTAGDHLAPRAGAPQVAELVRLVVGQRHPVDDHVGERPDSRRCQKSEDDEHHLLGAAHRRVPGPAGAGAAPIAPAAMPPCAVSAAMSSGWTETACASSMVMTPCITRFPSDCSSTNMPSRW